MPRGAVTRDDVATVLVGLLDRPTTAGKILELVGGDEAIDQAITRTPDQSEEDTDGDASARA